jgi:NADH dehydrogenase (ubiquinone) Fe-S protein 1
MMRLQAASRTASYDIGFTPSAASSSTPAKFVYLLSADDFTPSQIPSNAFVVYQGSHGDVGAQYADVCLPGAAYTEKSTTWVNTEGRTQLGRAAVGPPGSAREDWKIVRALSEVLGERLEYDTIGEMRDRMWEVCPTLVRYDELETVSVGAVKSGLASMKAIGRKVEGGNVGEFKKPIRNFYQTDSISRNSATMAKCTVRPSVVSTSLGSIADAFLYP